MRINSKSMGLVKNETLGAIIFKLRRFNMWGVEGKEIRYVNINRLGQWILAIILWNICSIWHHCSCTNETQWNEWKMYWLKFLSTLSFLIPPTKGIFNIVLLSTVATRIIGFKKLNLFFLSETQVFLHSWNQNKTFS